MIQVWSDSWILPAAAEWPIGNQVSNPLTFRCSVESSKSTSGISVGFPNVHWSSAFHRRYCTPCRPSTSGSSLVMMAVGLVEWPPRRITWRHVGRQRQTPPDPSSCWWGPFPWRQCICCAIGCAKPLQKTGGIWGKVIKLQGATWIEEQFSSSIFVCNASLVCIFSVQLYLNAKCYWHPRRNHSWNQSVACESHITGRRMGH